jgi:membrane-bound lytic murein transglycosylase D
MKYLMLIIIIVFSNLRVVAYETQSNDSTIDVSTTDIAAIFDKMTREKFFNAEHFTPEANKYNYPANFIPEYNDSLLIARIQEMDEASPFEYQFNEDVKRWITFYISKRYFVGRLVGLTMMYYPLFEQAFDKYNVPLEMKHLAIVESALNPTAKSWAGAAGLWQFMYKTGLLYDLNITSYVDDRFDPMKATEAAAHHMNDLYAIYHDWALVLAAYNAGPGTINRAIKRANGETNYWKIKHLLPRETQQYVPAFIGASYVITYFAEHNIAVQKPEYIEWELDTVSVKATMSFNFFSSIVGIPEDEMVLLNPQYIRKIIPGTSSHPYLIRMPQKYALVFVEKEQLMYDSLKKAATVDSAMVASNSGTTNNNTTTTTTTTTTTAGTGTKNYHTVQNGETLGTIASVYGTTVSNIQAWNSMKSTVIYPGQKLIVYGSASSTYKPNNGTSNGSSDLKTVYYTVKQGDTLWKISSLYGVSVDDIRKANNLKSDNLQVGQKLKIHKNS